MYNWVSSFEDIDADTAWFFLCFAFEDHHILDNQPSVDNSRLARHNATNWVLMVDTTNLLRTIRVAVNADLSKQVADKE